MTKYAPEAASQAFRALVSDNNSVEVSYKLLLKLLQIIAENEPA